MITQRELGARTGRHRAVLGGRAVKLGIWRDYKIRAMDGMHYMARLPRRESVNGSVTNRIL